MKYTTQDIAALIKETRRQQRLTQEDLAMACGTGVRFIIDLEKGKPTCQIEKVLHVLHSLGIDVNMTAPHQDGVKYD